MRSQARVGAAGAKRTIAPLHGAGFRACHEVGKIAVSRRWTVRHRGARDRPAMGNFIPVGFVKSSEGSSMNGRFRLSLKSAATDRWAVARTRLPVVSHILALRRIGDHE